MDKTTISAVREAIKGDALTDEVKDKLGEIESFYDEMIAKASKYEDLQKDNDKLQIKFMAEKSKRESAESVIEDLKGLNADSEKDKKELETLREQIDTLKSENQNLNGLKVERDNELRKSYNDLIEKYKEKEAFAKVKDKFVLPSEEQKLEDLEMDAIKSGLEKFEEYQNLGIFETNDTRTSGKSVNESPPNFLEKVFGHS